MDLLMSKFVLTIFRCWWKLSRASAWAARVCCQRRRASLLGTVRRAFQQWRSVVQIALKDKYVGHTAIWLAGPWARRVYDSVWGGWKQVVASARVDRLRISRCSALRRRCWRAWYYLACSDMRGGMRRSDLEPLLTLDQVLRCQAEADRAYYGSLVSAVSQRHARGCRKLPAQPVARPPLTVGAVASGGGDAEPFDLDSAVKAVSGATSGLEAKQRALSLACNGTLAVCSSPSNCGIAFLPFSEVARIIRGVFPLEDLEQWSESEYAEVAICTLGTGHYHAAGVSIAHLLAVAADGRRQDPLSRRGRFWNSWRAAFAPPPPPPAPIGPGDLGDGGLQHGRSAAPPLHRAHGGDASSSRDGDAMSDGPVIELVCPSIVALARELRRQ